MCKINPETAAHTIAKLFCEQQFKEISTNALKQWKQNTSELQFKGDPNVAIVKALSNEYCYAYETAFEQCLESNNMFDDLEESIESPDNSK